MDHTHEQESTSTFWKKNSTFVPGRPSPQHEVGSFSKKATGSTSFHDFEESVSDAWDMNDDSLLTTIEQNAHISKRVSHSAALNVLNCHRATNSSMPFDANSLHKTDCEFRNLRSSTISIQPLRPTLINNVQTITSTYAQDNSESKVERFNTFFANSANLQELRKICWSGIPNKVRPIAWRLLSEYLPMNSDRRSEVLERKRQDYWNLVDKYFYVELDEINHEIQHQINIDVPRMNPFVPLFQQEIVQSMFVRILFIWAIRHPASGYVQGINDLVTPFFTVFLQEYLPNNVPYETYNTSLLSREQLQSIEADSFWCLSKFLDGIQDNYVFAQIGIQQKVHQLEDLIKRVDEQLHTHLKQHNVSYLQFAFRWLNNLLTREIPLRCAIRLWDTYLSENEQFGSFQLYVCVSFLLYWREQLLRENDFQGLLLLLQNLPTQSWTTSEISLLVAEAYKLKVMFADCPNHLNKTSNS